MSAPVIPLAVPTVTPIVEVGIGDRYDAARVAGLWGTARWSTPGDVNEWGGQEPLWNDVTCEVLECSTFAGRQGSIDAFEVGTATVVVRNLDGWADYKPPGVNDNILTLRPGRQVRVGVAVAADPSVYWLWRGTIDVTEPGYRPGEGDTVTLGCVDALGDAGRAKLTPLPTPTFPGDYAYQRFARVLDAVAWPAWRRTWDTDAVALTGTRFTNQAGDELKRTAESASGHVYGGLDGKVTLRRRDWMTWPAAAPTDATIGNVAGGDVCPSGWEVRFARADVTTRVIAGRDGEAPTVFDNADGMGLMGTETWERNDLMPAENFEMARIAQRVLAARSPDVMPRIAAVTLDPATGGGAVTAVLAAASPFTPTRWRCRHRATDGRLVFDRLMMVTGITHTISPADGWVARVTLDDATPFRQVTNPARWSDADTRWSTDDQWAKSL